MRKIINLLLVLLAGSLIIYHRLYEPINVDYIFLALLVFGIVMLVSYRRIHQYSHFYIVSLLVITFYSVIENELIDEGMLFDFILISLTALTLSLFVVSLVVRFNKVKDRIIKKRINKLVFIYAVWILLFYSPFTNSLLVFIIGFSGPVSDHIDTALNVFWLIADLGFIVVLLAQLYATYLIDEELIYRKNKIKQREIEAQRNKENEKDIFGYERDFYETNY